MRMEEKKGREGKATTEMAMVIKDGGGDDVGVVLLLETILRTRDAGPSSPMWCGIQGDLRWTTTASRELKCAF
jgi:hypothetical protein